MATAVLTIGEIRAQLRLCPDEDSQDDWLESLELQAIDYASQYIGRSIPWANEAGDPVPVPASIKRALLLLIADFDQHRENTVMGVSVANRKAAENLLHFYRVGLGI